MLKLKNEEIAHIQPENYLWIKFSNLKQTRNEQVNLFCSFSFFWRYELVYDVITVLAVTSLLFFLNKQEAIFCIFEYPRQWALQKIHTWCSYP